MFNITDICMVQKQTQSNPGGLTDIYVKSFYSVIHQPQCVKVTIMRTKFGRIHHRINSNKCYPKILNQCWKKE